MINTNNNIPFTAGFSIRAGERLLPLSKQAVETVFRLRSQDADTFVRVLGELEKHVEGLGNVNNHFTLEPHPSRSGQSLLTYATGTRRPVQSLVDISIQAMETLGKRLKSAATELANKFDEGSSL